MRIKSDFVPYDFFQTPDDNYTMQVIDIDRHYQIIGHFFTPVVIYTFAEIINI